MTEERKKITSIVLPRGKHCFIWNNFKVFDYKEVEKTDEDVEMGDGALTVQQASIIQNICWLYGLAPRIVGVHRVRFFNKIFIAQETELLDYRKRAQTDEEAYKIYDSVLALGVLYGWKIKKHDVSQDDVLEGKLVDFGSFVLEDDFQERVKKIIVKKARYGKTYYQTSPLLGLLEAPRDSLRRVEYLKLDEVDFKNKSVLDLGCSNGFFCRYASLHGARVIEGVDHKSQENDDPIKAAYLTSFLLGHHNIYYTDMDLTSNDSWYSMFKFDIVFYLSMNYHIGIPDWLNQITGGVCIFEDNSRKRDALPTLRRMFKRVEYMGEALDHGNKPIYHCYV